MLYSQRDTLCSAHNVVHIMIIYTRVRYIKKYAYRHDSSVEQLTVCSPRGPGHDSSLSVLPVAQVMIAQWDSSLSVLPVARVMIAQ